MDETLSVESFTKMLKILLKEASISAHHNSRVVDIVKDVINRVPIYWAANFVVCLKTSGPNRIIHVSASLVCLSLCSTVFGPDIP